MGEKGLTEAEKEQDSCHFDNSRYFICGIANMFSYTFRKNRRQSIVLVITPLVLLFVISAGSQ